MVFILSLLLAGPKAEKPEVHFQADNCSYGRAMAEAVCTGRVRVRRGDVQLRCKNLTVRFDEEGKLYELI